MSWLGFNLAETRGLFVLLVLLLIGSGIAIYKKYHTDFPVEIIFKESKAELKQYKSNKSIQHNQQDSQRKEVSSISNKEISKKLNLNTASWAELDLLPYIGPVLSKRIVEYREKYGKFKEVDGLLKVKGIGKKNLEKVREYVEIK